MYNRACVALIEDNTRGMTVVLRRGRSGGVHKMAFERRTRARATAPRQSRSTAAPINWSETGFKGECAFGLGITPISVLKPVVIQVSCPNFSPQVYRDSKELPRLPTLKPVMTQTSGLKSVVTQVNCPDFDTKAGRNSKEFLRLRISSRS
ncbi:hypothetical protein EVAR_12844_1 [Eumeta japonica]|uniref:Uncharacterized protein n=1 Tax=Eumeta variegata TaxID=151549 RepID=A0A4C1UAY5_EUMVA|nr:hypothetical protein EVAR_12844_1 [Eumeta japonica]